MKPSADERVAQAASSLIAAVRELAHSSCEVSDYVGLRALPERVQRQRLRFARSNSQWEPWLSAALAEHLFSHGIAAFAEVDYPLSARRVESHCDAESCDLVVDLGHGDYFWLECKAAFTVTLKPLKDEPFDYDYSGESGKRKNCDWKVSVDSAKRDAEKLMKLRCPEAKYVGILLMVFDLIERPVSNDEINRQIALAPEWIPTNSSQWQDTHVGRRDLGFQERCLIWYRAVS